MDYGAKSRYLIKPNKIFSQSTNFVWNSSNELLFCFFGQRPNNLYNMNADILTTV